MPIITSEVLDFMIFMANQLMQKYFRNRNSNRIFRNFLAKISDNLTTIEIDEKRYLEAKENFEKYGIKNVTQILGDANEQLLN